MLTPQIIDAMVDNGCTAQQIAAVVKAALIAQQETNQEKRARDAERQRRCRSKSQPVTDCHVMSRDVTVTECDPSLPPLVPTLSPLQTTPLAPPIIPPNSPNDVRQQILPMIEADLPKPSKQARAVALPKGRDWVLPDEWGDWAMEKYGWTVEEVVDIATEFRNYWAAEGGAKGRKVDWELTWQNRCREVWKRKESQRLKDEKYEQIRYRKPA